MTEPRVRIGLLAVIATALVVALLSDSAVAWLTFLAGVFGSVTWEMFGSSRLWIGLFAAVALGLALGLILDSALPWLTAAALGLGVAVWHEVTDRPSHDHQARDRGQS